MRKTGRLARLVRVAAWSHLAAVLALWAGLLAIGERWWLLTVARYLPRAPFALPLGGVPPGFVRYTVETPLGPLGVYNVHFQTPRPGLYRARERLPQMLSTGDAGGADESVETNSAIRRQQVERLLAHAAQARHPVVIAG